jgi:hypothetical protein
MSIVRLGISGDRLIARFEVTGREISTAHSKEMVGALYREHVDPDCIFGIDWRSDIDPEFGRIPWSQVNEIKALLRQRVAAIQTRAENE